MAPSIRAPDGCWSSSLRSMAPADGSHELIDVIRRPVVVERDDLDVIYGPEWPGLAAHLVNERLVRASVDHRHPSYLEIIFLQLLDERVRLPDLLILRQSVKV